MKYSEDEARKAFEEALEIIGVSKETQERNTKDLADAEELLQRKLDEMVQESNENDYKELESYLRGELGDDLLDSIINKIINGESFVEENRAEDCIHYEKEIALPEVSAYLSNDRKYVIITDCHELYISIPFNIDTLSAYGYTIMEVLDIMHRITFNMSPKDEEYESYKNKMVYIDNIDEYTVHISYKSLAGMRTINEYAYASSAKNPFQYNDHICSILCCMVSCVASAVTSLVEINGGSDSIKVDSLAYKFLTTIIATTDLYKDTVDITGNLVGTKDLLVAKFGSH